MDIDGAERGEQETINGPGLAGSCSGRTTAASVVTAGLRNGWGLFSSSANI